MSAVGDGVRTVLAIDTATDAVVAGIVRIQARAGSEPSAEALAEAVVADHRRHAELLTTLIAQVLAESGVARSDLAAVIVGCGPGPFTGLRVGMATGAAFADALAIPAYGVCTLDALAAGVVADEGAESDSNRSILAVTDARRREVYWAHYRGGRRLRGPEVAAPATVAEQIGGLTVDTAVGSADHLGLTGYCGPVTGSPWPGSAALARVAVTEVLSGAAGVPLTPLYLRRPDAVERKDQIRKGSAVSGG